LYAVCLEIICTEQSSERKIRRKKRERETISFTLIADGHIALYLIMLTFYLYYYYYSSSTHLSIKEDVAKDVVEEEEDAEEVEEEEEKVVLAVDVLVTMCRTMVPF
jgi:Ca2+/Na+ antiporter